MNVVISFVYYYNKSEMRTTLYLYFPFSETLTDEKAEVLHCVSQL